MIKLCHLATAFCLLMFKKHGAANLYFADPNEHFLSHTIFSPLISNSGLRNYCVAHIKTIGRTLFKNVMHPCVGKAHVVIEP